jgi:hypothetical protein
MKLIAFTGLAQSGKSTASAYLESTHNFHRVNFKSAMIEEIKSTMPDFLKKEAEIYNCQVDDLFAMKPGSFRQFLQNYGTELRRKGDNDYWVNQWLTKANSLYLDTGASIVVDDVRFLNEAEMIKRAGGIIIRVVKNGQENTMSHSSETEMSQIIADHIISVEPGDVETLCKEVQKIYESTK